MCWRNFLWHDSVGRFDVPYNEQNPYFRRIRRNVSIAMDKIGFVLVLLCLSGRTQWLHTSTHFNQPKTSLNLCYVTQHTNHSKEGEEMLYFRYSVILFDTALYDSCYITTSEVFDIGGTGRNAKPCFDWYRAVFHPSLSRYIQAHKIYDMLIYYLIIKRHFFIYTAKTAPSYRKLSTANYEHIWKCLLLSFYSYTYDSDPALILWV